jgi:hypothetical protein
VANGTYKGIIDIAAPGNIGEDTPGAGTFTTLTLPSVVDATLSGTPVIITIYDSATGTPYYFKAYPTKP